MAKHHGKNGKAKLGANAVAAVTRWTLQQTVETSDTTSMDHDGWQTHNTGLPAWSGTIDAWYDPEDINGQVALVIGGSITIGLFSDGDGAGKKYFSGTASVTQISHETPVGGTVTFSISVTGNGALTTETVSG